ncbi:progranulin-like [Argiope bruennichi]|uniref:Progranulin like protein n=1 Tax=Argiope bruennichi TaxID=94029 RepID=A0A8T0FQ36_ARGBR|nr:progranulin-like [Argiope bruennichi]KAF8793294.1 Progranulin like protein [Argiope bruennichi]
MDLKGILLSILLGFACLFSVLKAGNAHQSCKTQCGDSCCPHENGVCCEGGSACCRQGQTCLTNIDTCVGLRDTANGNVTLHSEKASPVSGFYCPSGTTPCEGGCCPYEDGVCCNDGYCCPQGFTCTPTTCEKAGVPNQSLRKGLAGKDPENNIMGHELKKLGIQICPDKLHLCPGSAECCRKNNGEWDCCPKVSNLKGECCSIWGIWMCCTDIAPKCHWWGCWFS